MRRTIITVLVMCFAIWLNNTSLLVSKDPNVRPKIIAHRGVHQVYVGPDRTVDTCTATGIAKPTHPYIANTLPSINAAFDLGADVVEVDVHLTRDNIFAVFHDWTLECQTDGIGETHDQDFGTLRGLDVGYGFTADGVTYPLRGHGVGIIPSLPDVLNTDGQILVNFKSNWANDGVALAALLKGSDARSSVFGVYGGTNPTQSAVEAIPDMRGFDKSSLKKCYLWYGLLGWSGYVPQTCRHTIVAIPIDYSPYLWGWPNRFETRMNRAGTEVILWGPYDGSGFSSGIDTADTLAEVPTGFRGYIWTNRIEAIGPLVTGQSSANSILPPVPKIER